MLRADWHRSLLLTVTVRRRLGLGSGAGQTPDCSVTLAVSVEAGGGAMPHRSNTIPHLSDTTLLDRQQTQSANTARHDIQPVIHIHFQCGHAGTVTVCHVTRRPAD